MCPGFSGRRGRAKILDVLVGVLRLGRQAPALQGNVL